MGRKVVVSACGLFLLLPIYAWAQANPANPAGSADSSQAIAADEARLRASPNDANGWEKLGSDYLQAGRYPEAVDAYQKALDHGFAPNVGKYNLACAYARRGDKQKALDLLESLPAGSARAMVGDPDLASLAGEPRFQQLTIAARRASEPCKDAQANPQYRQLDFWVGDWDVFSGTQKVGTSNVQLILKDCVVFENWAGLQGGSGKSFNKYNPVTQQWEQFWVSDSGTTNYFTGSLIDGEMRYTLQMPAPSGGTLIRHLTFSRLPEGKVRQFAQASLDNGKSWTTEYDFVYAKHQ